MSQRQTAGPLPCSRGQVKNRLCPHPHLKVLKSQVWHASWAGDDFESRIILELLNGLDCIVITANYREIMSSAENLFKGSDS